MNYKKSLLIPSPKGPLARSRMIARYFGMSLGSLPVKYLGAPLHGRVGGLPVFG